MKPDAKRRISGIYGLVENGVIMYIGQALDIRKRLAQHCSLAQNRGNRKVNLWLSELLSSNRRPELWILEETLDLDAREIYWIDDYRKVNPGLLNMADGGKSMGHLKRAKQTLPWGRQLAPTQRRLMMLQAWMRAEMKRGDWDEANITHELIRVINEKIKQVGTRKMNLMLWAKYGN